MVLAGAVAVAHQALPRPDLLVLAPIERAGPTSSSGGCPRYTLARFFDRRSQDTPMLRLCMGLIGRIALTKFRWQTSWA
jgi:hypothetical protein